MSDITRYAQLLSGLDESKRGEYVLYTDHEAALSAKDEEIERLKIILQVWIETVADMCPNGSFVAMRVAEILAQPSEHEATGEGK